MMPLILASIGETNMIRKVGGNPEVKKHLEDLGFVAGGEVTIISAIGWQPHCQREGFPRRNQP